MMWHFDVIKINTSLQRHVIMLRLKMAKFQDLRDEDDFMDVTLSCDGEQIRAHKVILSACSLTFRNLLKKNPTQNPVILLWVSA